MNVASLDLCKELYELSGWGEYPDRPHFAWREFIAKRTGSSWYSAEEDYTEGWRDPLDRRHATGITHNIEHVAPAYDLGYLLRKLPQFMLTRHDAKYYINNVTLDIRGPGLQSSFSNEADTPEDAACKLAIELFKRGVLE